MFRHYFKLSRVYFLTILIVINFAAQFAYASQLEAVKQYTQTIPRLKHKVSEVWPLSGGLTNQIYHVKTINGENFVLRVFGEEAAALGINPSQQADIAVRVGELGVGPKVVYLSDDKKYMLIDFVTGNSLTQELYTDGTRKKIMQQLRKMHEHGNFNTAFDPFKTATAFRQIALSKPIDTRASFPVADMDKAHLIIQQIKNVISHHSKRFMRYGHNDLHCGNILVDPRSGAVALIDLDYAGLSDLFFDLAIFANSLNLNPEEAT